MRRNFFIFHYSCNRNSIIQTVCPRIIISSNMGGSTVIILATEDSNSMQSEGIEYCSGTL